MSRMVEKMSSMATDVEVISLKERISESSVFEVMGKERSETVHTSFLAWLFAGKSISTTEAFPVNLLLHTLVQRGTQQIIDCVQHRRIDDDLAQAVCSGQLRVNQVKVETEVPVKKLAREALMDDPKNEMLKALVSATDKKGSDRIDMVIDLDVEGIEKVNKIQIILENKIDSKEGGEKANKDEIPGYSDKKQTERYYAATKRNNDQIKQIYVFLDSTTGAELDDVECFYNDIVWNCSCDKYIMICYQDILDKVIIPLLSSATLSAKARTLIEDYRNELSFPSLNQSGKVLALDRSCEDKVMSVWNKYKDLISKAVFAVSDDKYYVIGGIFTNDVLEAKKMIVERLLDPSDADEMVAKGWISNAPQTGFVDLRNGYYLKTSTRYSKIKEYGMEKGMEISEIDHVEDADSLAAFWTNNQDFLSRLLQMVKYIAYVKDDGVNYKASGLLSEVLKERDTTKYLVEFDGSYRRDGSSLGKGEAALEIVRCFVESGSIQDLQALRDALPIDCNDYYKTGRYFQHLFYEYAATYEYDGKEASGIVTGNWDFYRDDKHYLDLKNGQKVVMLRMWRKSTIEGLIKYLEKNHNAFWKRLKIVEA